MSIAFAFLLIASALRNIRHFYDNGIFDKVVFLIIYYIYITMLVAWSLSILIRIMHKHVRFYLLTVSALMCLWLLFRSVKYIPGGSTDQIARVLWYCYYIPIVLIPLLSFLVSICVGKPENWRPSNRFHYLFIPAFLLIGLVLTNDIHQKAFGFKKDFLQWDNSYSYGPVYYIIIFWILSLIIVSIKNLYAKSYVPCTKKRIHMPFIIVAGGILYGVIYAVEISAGMISTLELTPIICFLIVCLWETTIQAGLLPSNTNHYIFLNNSTLQIQILDEDKGRHFGSSKAFHMDSEIFNILVEEGTYRMGRNIILHLWPIRGGYAIWEEDVSTLMDVVDELSNKERELEQGLQVLKKEIEAKAHHFHISEQNRLYDLIFTHISPQLEKVKEIIRRGRSYSLNEQKELLKELNLLGVHIKRKGNLILIKESEGFIASEELIYSLKEIFESLKAWGVESTIKKKLKDTMDLNLALAFLDFFVQIVRDFIDGLSGVYVSVSERDDVISFTLQIENLKASAETEFRVENNEVINGLGGVVVVENQEEGITYFALNVPKEGEEL
jgi:uncharacterized protein YjgD (DUF1641 family)